MELILNLNLSSHQCLFLSLLDSVFAARRWQESRTVVGCCVPGLIGDPFAYFDCGNCWVVRGTDFELELKLAKQYLASLI